MNTNHYALIGAGVLFLASVVYASRRNKTGVAGTLGGIASSLKASVSPEAQSSADLLKQALTAIKDDGFDLAIKSIVEQFASAQAAEMKTQMQSTFSPKSPPTSPEQPPPSPPAA